MPKTFTRRDLTWLLAAVVLLAVLGAGCTCARQSDGGEASAGPQREATSPPPLINPDQDIPEVNSGEGDDAASASGQNEAEGEDGEADEAEATEDEESSDDPSGQEGEDEETEDESGDEGNGDEDLPADNSADEDETAGDEPAEPNPDIDAAAIYQAAMCYECHGAELDGTARGPSLKDIDKYWTAAELAQFLKAPTYYSADNQRLIGLSRQYNIAMPPLHRNDEEIYAVAHWLLNR